MENSYAKVIVKGSPISKSNFKLFNINGRAILPIKSGKYHDRYGIYEEQIALEARIQNPEIVLREGLIAVLKVYYKYKKRHPDTNNIPKSIFDGIEKSGLIINDAQIKHLVIEEFYDRENPRFELELFGESIYSLNFSIDKRENKLKAENYNPPPGKKNYYSNNLSKNNSKDEPIKKNKIQNATCEICKCTLIKSNTVSANNGKMLLCKDCLKKLF